MMTPGGRSRAVWDALRMICVVVDIIVIPLSFFDLPVNEVQVSLSALALVFWTSDIFVSFRTGYFEKGTLVLDTRKIARYYFKRWFFFDLSAARQSYIMTYLEHILEGKHMKTPYYSSKIGVKWVL